MMDGTFHDKFKLKSWLGLQKETAIITYTFHHCHSQSSVRTWFLEAKTRLDIWDNLSVITAPSSPVHNRRLLSARNMRMSSVELPDENEKSLSSASTSPCPSPVSAQRQIFCEVPSAYLNLSLKSMFYKKDSVGNWLCAVRWSENPPSLWNLNVHYSVHKILPVDSILSQLNSVHTLTPYFCKINLNILPYF